MKIPTLVPLAAIGLALGAAGYAAGLAVPMGQSAARPTVVPPVHHPGRSAGRPTLTPPIQKPGRSPARSSVTPPSQHPVGPPTITPGSVVSDTARAWVRLRVPGGGDGAGTTIRLTASTLFFKIGVGRITRSDVLPGDRVAVGWRRLGSGFVAARVTVLGPRYVGA